MATKLNQRNAKNRNFELYLERADRPVNFYEKCFDAFGGQIASLSLRCLRARFHMNLILNRDALPRIHIFDEKQPMRKMGIRVMILRGWMPPNYLVITTIFQSAPH